METFPTFRCDNGTAFNHNLPCPEISQSPGWISDYASYDIAVQHSRQIYFYSVGFHLTGNIKMLQHAAAGVKEFLRKFVDTSSNKSGAICTYVAKYDGACLPSEELRTSMEHANALIGFAFYYYVTQNILVGEFLVKAINYCYERFYRESWQMMGMADATPPNASVPITEGQPLEAKRDLLVQLDQTNAYMMILRHLPSELGEEVEK